MVYKTYFTMLKVYFAPFVSFYYNSDFLDLNLNKLVESCIKKKKKKKTDQDSRFCQEI